MRKLEMTQATASLAEYARELDQGPIILMVDGKPTAALVPLDGVDAETASLSTNPQFMALIERSRSSSERGLSSGGMRERLGLKPRASRRPKSKRARNAKSSRESAK